MSTAWTSLTSTDLRVSLRVPVGWSVDVVEEQRLELHGHPAPYLTTLALESGVAEQPGRAWFEAFSDAVPAQLLHERPDLVLRTHDLFALSSPGALVTAVTLRSPADGAVPPTSHLMAWVWHDDDRVLVLRGATATEREADDLPVLQAVLRSLRLLPPPVG